MYYIFPDVNNRGELYKSIHPKKQEVVYQLLQDVPPNIEAIGVFGSALTPHCKDDSDIDIIIIASTYNHEFKTKGLGVDVLDYRSLDSLVESAEVGGFNSIAYNIINEGVFIYEKKPA